MTSETIKLKSKLSILSSSLDDLEAHLEPLFAQSLPESIISLETIQQAKLHTVLPYLVYDLIFIYLKSKGVDPKTHPVVAELDRVRQYFNKITSAEDPATKRTAVDKAAADRFIKHAITQAKNAQTPAASAPLPPKPSTTPLPIKVTSKMRERARYEQEIKDADKLDDEEAALEVWGDEPPDERAGMDVDGGEAKKTKKTKKTPKEKGKGKGKAKAKQTAEQPPPVPAVVEEEIPKIGTKRRRPSIDPFAGYGDDIPVVDDPSGEAKDMVDPEPNSIDILMTDTSELASNQSTPGPKGSNKKRARKKG